VTQTLLAPLSAVLLLQVESAQPYRDPGGRFSFSYPFSFGSPGAGTNDGFGDRLAAIGFSSFPARLGGEAVLTRGFPLVDLQAAGGLYDGITLEVFPEPLRKLVVTQLPRPTAANLCATLAREQHLDPGLPAFASLTLTQKDAISRTDRMRNAVQRVVDCRISGDTVTFDKERASGPDAPTHHVYGAVRFLDELFSTFQLIAGGDAPPDSAALDAIAGVVRSFTAR
jgi:hypothetical protein